MEKNKKYSLVKLLNPFYMFALVWSFVLLLYMIQFSSLLSKLKFELFTVLIVLIITSVLIGKFTENTNYSFIKNKEINYLIYMRFFSLVILIYFIVVTLLDGSIPFFSIIYGTKIYGSQLNIPLITFGMYTLALFVGSLSFVEYCKQKNNEYLIYVGLVAVFFILLVQRGMIVYLFVISLLSYLYLNRVSKKAIFCIACLVFLFLILFSIYGNIRSGIAWNNFDYFYHEWGLTNSLLPKQLAFPYMYITSPLANLQRTILDVSPIYSFGDFIITSLLPDFISNDISVVIPNMSLVTESLNVGSTFSVPYITMGYLGIVLNFISYAAIFLFFKVISNYNNTIKVFTAATLCSIAIFSFFDNYITFSGLNIILVFPFVILFMDTILKYYISYKEKNND